MMQKDDKKGAKKDSKEPADTKTVSKSDFPEDEKQYCYLGEGQMYKCVRSTLAVEMTIK